MKRYIFLYFCSVLAFVMSGMCINFLQVVIYFTLKPISDYLYRKVMYYLCYNYFSLYVFLTDWYSNCELNLYMDKKDYQKYWGKEFSYIICNHSYEIDWMLLLSLAEKSNCLGNSKCFCKDDAKYIPGLGYLLYFADYIFLARKIEKDKKIIEDAMQEILKYPDPVWLILYPEGTRFRKTYHQNSMHFAKLKGLPTFKHHLSPRTKGFTTSIAILRDKIQAVYDVTIDFKQSSEYKPKITNILFGNKVDVSFYIRRIPIENVPMDEEGALKFLNDLFVHKDKLRDSFLKHEDFFTDLKQRGVEKITFNRNYCVLMNALFWYVLSNGLVLNYLLNLILVGHTHTFVLFSAIILAISYIMNKLTNMSKYDKGS